MAAAKRNVDASPSAWAKNCGVCHVGGGQMEYDRDLNSYGAGASGDRYTYRMPHVAAAGGEDLKPIGAAAPTHYAAGALVPGMMIDIGDTDNADVVGTELYGTNNAEVDCMMCHMSNTNVGAAWYKSMGCSADNPIGPADDPTCSGPRFTFTKGAIYDDYNRNYAVSYGWFDIAASAGLGVKIDTASGQLGESMPTSIAGSSIAGVPDSNNCAFCHARSEKDDIGLPGEAQVYGGMITGYGNFFTMTQPGDAIDLDEIDGSGTTCASGKDCRNDTVWNQFGCKTGMGKRSHKTGQGSSDRFGFGVCLGCATMEYSIGMCNPMVDPQNCQWWRGMDHVAGNADDGVCALPSIQAACNAKAGTVLQGAAGQWTGIFNPDFSTKGIAGKMPDIDVHDKAGLKCGTCHYALSGTLPARTVSANVGGTTYSYTYPATSDPIQRIDHQVAQGFGMNEHANDQADGTVTCESCHISHDHPNAGSAPTPTHAGFPAVHFEKIDCRTCHIPSVYSSPGRLGLRDWTAGGYRQIDGSNGNANHFDFAFNFMDGTADPMPTLRAWVTNPAGTKITPMLPSLLPVWTGSAIRASDDFVMGWSPAKTRDITTAAAMVSANNPGFGIRLNGTNEHPPFQGFQLTDPLKIESKTKIDAMAAELAVGTRTGLVAHGTVRDPRINLFPVMFDPSHGVLDKEWALGAGVRGSCLACHSTPPANPAIGCQTSDGASCSEYSVGFFSSTKEVLKNPMMQMTDYDCGGDDMQNMPPSQGGSMDNNMWSNAVHPDWMCGMFDNPSTPDGTAGACDAAELMACRTYIGRNLFPMFGMPADVGDVFPIDGVAMMQMMAVREGAMTLNGCNPIYAFFGFPNSSTGHGVAGTNGCDPSLGDYFSRDEIRSHYKKNLQQSRFTPVVAGSRWVNPVSNVTGTVPSSIGRVVGIVSVANNPSTVDPLPSNPGKIVFDLGATCWNNPMDHSAGTKPCGDGDYIKTSVTANQLLNYDAVSLANLQNQTDAYVERPTANFGIARNALAVTVDARATICSVSPSCDPATGTCTCSYSWNFGDGGTASGTKSWHTYASAGSYTITLRVVDNQHGTVASKTKSVTVNEPDALPGLSGLSCTDTGSSPATNTGKNKTFAGIATDATDVAKLRIEWGDGSVVTALSFSGTQTSQEFSTPHAYAVPGTYTVKTTVYDNIGQAVRGASTTCVYSPATLTYAKVTGIVKTSAGAPIPAAYVTLTTSRGLRKAAYTNSSGIYTISNVASGTVYRIDVIKSGYTFNTSGPYTMPDPALPQTRNITAN